MSQHGFYASAVIRTATSISSNRNSDDARNRIFSVAEVARFRNFCHQLIDSWINIICKLYFYNRFKTYCAHSYGRTYNVCFLNGGIENSFISKFLLKRYRFSENAPNSSAYILTIKQCFRMFVHQFLYGVNSCIYHWDFFSIFWNSSSFFFCDRSRSVNMLFYGFRFWVWSENSFVKVFFYLFSGFNFYLR